jgi:hypothetical protein
VVKKIKPIRIKKSQIHFASLTIILFLLSQNKTMETAKLFEILAYTLPSLITGGVAYYLFTAYFKDQQNTRRWLLQKENQKDALPLRLQAYERMALFLERINPTKLLIRITPLSSDKNDYENLVIAQIEQEFDHNLTQQIYLSDECWTIIITAKNATIQTIRKTAMSERVDSADKLREVILSDLMEKATPSSAALSYLKNELNQFL